jgi:hypothetical protein
VNPLWRRLVTAPPAARHGPVRDPLEVAADAAAARVLRAPDGRAVRGDRSHPEIAATAGDTATPQDTVARSIQSRLGAGEPIAGSTRAFMELRFGIDLNDVRVHTDGKAAESARAVNALAFTVGRDVVFGAGQYVQGTNTGRRLLAHELAHVAQQRTLGPRVQRYTSGEHAQLGETADAIKKLIEGGFKDYVVLEDDFPDTIAKSQSVTVDELKDANRTKLQTLTVVQHPGPDPGAYMVIASSKDPKGERVWLTNRTKVEIVAKGSEWHTIKVLSRSHKGTEGKIRTIFVTEVEGFAIGEKTRIPSFPTAATKEASKGKPLTFKINGVDLEYGVGIAMGDLFETPEQMAKASAAELTALAALIKREQSGKPVSTDEWQKATGGRYLELAKKNVTHFAPPDPSLVTPSTAGATSANHKTEWEKHHRAALDASQAGDKDKALMLNAFADHFLTDAFAAGHLINKTDAMEAFKSQLKLDAKGEEFTKPSQQFFDDVAKAAFVGSVKTEFSKYETVKTYYGVHADIDSDSRFSTLLQEIHKVEPDLLANAVAKGVHDKLNTLPGGLPVENARGDPPWPLSGDGTLNAKTKEVALKAVAQSQLNVLSVHTVPGPLAYADLFKKVWDYTPRPSKGAGMKQVADEVKKGTEINSPDLRQAVVKLITDNYLLIIAELVKRKKLQKN